MITALIISLSIVLLFYAGLIAVFIWGWSRSVPLSGSKTIHHSYSIVIAARNEAQTIALLLHDLLHQTYPMDGVQIVIIDDHSEDETQASIRYFCDQLHIEVYQLPNECSGKKAAINFALRFVANQNIVFLDADCRLGQEWLQSMTQQYEQQHEGLLCGPVQFSPDNKTIFGKIMQVEFAFLVASGGAMARANRPIFCNAANMIVDKTNYRKAQDYIQQTGASGDDVFLLHYLKQQGQTISFCKCSESIVYTDAPPNFGSFMQQRLRWAAKSKRYRDLDSIIVSCLVLLANVSVVLLAAGLLGGISFKLFITYFALKSLCDALFFVSFASFFSIRRLFWLVMVLPLFYSLYVVSVVGLMFWFKPRWKGRMVAT